jgi:hypothetical protein
VITWLGWSNKNPFESFESFVRSPTELAHGLIQPEVFGYEKIASHESSEVTPYFSFVWEFLAPLWKLAIGRHQEPPFLS